VVAIGVVLAGAPARRTAQAAEIADVPVIEVEIDREALPAVSIGPEVAALNETIATEGENNDLAAALAEDLAIEGQAMLRADPSLLRAADDGERLIEMERKIEVAATRDELVVANYVFESLHLDVIFTDGTQDGASLAFEARGTVELVTFNSTGEELARSTEPFDSVFVMRSGVGDRWVIVAELPPE
jgi:hypothetical protein